jgi:hypothetical protein
MTERLWLTSYSQRMTGQTQTYPAPVCQGGTSRALLQRLVLISPSSIRIAGLRILMRLWNDQFSP